MVLGQNWSCLLKADSCTYEDNIHQRKETKTWLENVPMGHIHKPGLGKVTPGGQGIPPGPQDIYMGKMVIGQGE